MKKKMSRNLSNKRVKKQIRITKKGGVKLNKSVKRRRPSKKTVKVGGFFCIKVFGRRKTGLLTQKQMKIEEAEAAEEREYKKKLADAIKKQQRQANEFAKKNNSKTRMKAAQFLKRQGNTLRETEARNNYVPKEEYLSAISNNNNPISIKIGDELEILEIRDDGWTKVKRGDGKVGLVPTSYIEVPVREPTIKSPSNRRSEYSTNSSHWFNSNRSFESDSFPSSPNGSKSAPAKKNSLNLNNLDFRGKKKLLLKKENPESLQQIIVELKQSLGRDEQDMYQTANRRYLRKHIEQQKNAVERLEKYLKQSKK